MAMTEKQQEAVKTVKRYMWWSMGAGLVPVPVLDLAAVSGVQLKMLAEISRIYDVPVSEKPREGDDRFPGRFRCSGRVVVRRVRQPVEGGSAGGLRWQAQPRWW